MISCKACCANLSANGEENLCFIPCIVTVDHFLLDFKYDRKTDLPKVLNMRVVNSIKSSSSSSVEIQLFDVDIFYKTIRIVLQDEETIMCSFADMMNQYMNIPNETDKNWDTHLIDSVFFYYLMMNSLTLEETGFNMQTLTKEKKLKFITNNESKMNEQTRLLFDCYRQLMRNPRCASIRQLKEYVMNDYLLGSVAFIQCDGINFLCDSIMKIVEAGGSRVNDDEVLLCYVSILAKICKFAEASSIVNASPHIFLCFRDLLHHKNPRIVHQTLLLMLSFLCDDYKNAIEYIVQSFIEEKQCLIRRYESSSVAQLIELMARESDNSINVCILRFLTLLVMMTKDLAMKLFLIEEYNEYGFLSTCKEIQQKLEKSGDSIGDIFQIAEDAMRTTITDEDLTLLTQEDIPSLSRIVSLHCSDEDLQEDYLRIMCNLVCLPSEGSCCDEVWKSLADFVENLVNVSSQWTDRSSLGTNMIKKTRAEKNLHSELDAMTKECKRVKSEYEELQYEYNRVVTIEKSYKSYKEESRIREEEYENRIRLLNKEISDLKVNVTKTKLPPVPLPPKVSSPRSFPSSPKTRFIAGSPPPPPPPPSLSTSSPALSPSITKSRPSSMALSSPPPLSCASSITPVSPIVPGKKKVDLRYKKYFKLKTMHIPIDNLKVKIEGEGLDPSVIDMEEEPDYLEENAPAQPAIPIVPGKKKVDLRYKKYFKLKTMHIPIDNLKVKIEGEGLDPSIIDMEEEPDYLEENVKEENVSAKSVESPPKAAEKPVEKVEIEIDSYVPPTREKQHPSKPLRQLYWSPVGGKALENTIWESLKEQKDLVDKKELESLFEVKQNTNSSQLSALPAVTEEEHSFVDTKRETNIGIALRKMRYNGDELKKILFKASKYSLSQDSLLVISSILPKEDECYTIHAYQGDIKKLSFVNSFLYTVSEIPNCLERVQCLIIRASFNEEKEKCIKDLKDFSSDINLVLTNTHFTYLLEYIIEIGNYLNGTSTRGGACGFHIDILPQLERTKSSDSSTSIIDFMVKSFIKTNTDVLRIITEYDVLGRRCELSLDDIQKAVSTMRANLHKIKTIADIAPMSEEDSFSEELSSFYASANEEFAEVGRLSKDVADKYTKMCKAFGEDGRKMKSTEFFSYIVSFISSLKSSYKSYLDQQAQEKLKKVSTEWKPVKKTLQRKSLEKTQDTEGKKIPVGGMKLPSVAPPPLPAKKESVENEGKSKRSGKKQTLIQKLFSWGN